MAAEAILIPVAKSILGKAADLAAEQIGLLWNFKRELKKLKDTVTIIQAVLRDAEEKQFHNHQVKDWLEKLSDVMYDADDLLDDVSTETRRKAMTAEANGGRRRTMATTTTCWSVVCFLFSSLCEQLAYDLKMAHAIRAIREKLDDISKDKDGLHLEVLSKEDALPLRETDSCPPTIVVGREDDKKNIIQLLLHSNREANISVVPIVGMGGLGKTTLAQLVYDDDRVEAYFDTKVWVYVSQSFDIKVILGKMLQSINPQSQVGSSLDNLQAELRKSIKGKRFLFALDDVWEENVESWELLTKYLIVGAPGSKVLVTTRSTKVGEVGGRTLKSETSTSIVAPYLLEGLSLEESWDLMVKKALPRKITVDPYVKEIGQDILRKCGGVPLAVSSIAGMLISSKHPKIEWPSFLHKGFLSISKDGNRTMAALQLSFSHLPSHMKHCFAYCKLFAKGFLFDVQMLVQFWIAQGYIESEDEGMDCFKMLWWRSFFQEVKTDEFGNISSCRMHDLMHDLSDSITRDKIRRISSSTAALTNFTSSSRHLSLFEEGDDSISLEEADNSIVDDELKNASKVRSFLCWKDLSTENWEGVLLKFNRLRVLIMVAKVSKISTASKQLSCVSKLKHLRVLSFFCQGMKRVPDSITNLLNLQVLMVTSSSLNELPRGLRKLVNLKHLILHPDCLKNFTYMPKGIGELKHLRTLSFFVMGNKNYVNDKTIGELDELKGLNALCGELIITNLANAETLGTCVHVLKNKLLLHSLVLNWSRYDVTPQSISDEEILEMLCPHPNLMKLKICGGYGGVKLPNWLSTIRNLVEISLENCTHCKNLPPLHHISGLKKLNIENCPQLKRINKNAGGGGGYHCDSSPNDSTPTKKEDKEWPQFPCLASLRIKDCPNLTQAPTFPTVAGELVLDGASLQLLARTMEMVRADYLDEFITVIEYGDTNPPFLPYPPSSTFVSPLSKLRKLRLDGIDDDLESLPNNGDFNNCLVSLQELKVRDIRWGAKLPSSLCSSTNLTVIHLQHCERVKYLPPLHKLPSLAELLIGNCPRLKGCWSKKKKKKKKGEEWPHFPCLSTLQIRGCPNLTRMPLFPTIEGNLTLWMTSSRALVETMKMKVTAHDYNFPQYSTTTTTETGPSPTLPRTVLVSPLSKLTSLSLCGMDDLESLPEKGLGNLTSLQELVIEKCPRLATLPPAMQQLTSLQTLDIWRCPRLAERCRKEDGKDWHNISHIPFIEVDGKTLQNSGCQR
ncbi:unnamed protein product [Linum trigynum]|uniref:Uncharacterized protein n=1 Tax=Linum trigynum TaxID=586398 RepID=A0AAV2E1Z3_9ROSI